MRESAAMSVDETRSQLLQLAEERAAAVENGLEGCEAYMADLEQDISIWRAAYLTAAVTEIASFRAQLSGPQVG
jgi:hypothetical protein